MGWIAERFENTVPTGRDNQAAEQTFEASAEKVWTRLADGFEADVKEINARNGDADFKQLSDHQVRISSTATKLAAVVSADLPAHTIHYGYEPEDAMTAVPEQGVLTMRSSRPGIELYSADERLSSDQARRLILEPLFFVNPPLQATGT